MLVDRSGRVWVGTVAGLFVRDTADDLDSPFHLVELGTLSGDAARVRILALMEDRRDLRRPRHRRRAAAGRFGPEALRGRHRRNVDSGGASLSIVTGEARSSLPALGYAGAYAFANVLLTVAGSLVLLF